MSYFTYVFVWLCVALLLAVMLFLWALDKKRDPGLTSIKVTTGLGARLQKSMEQNLLMFGGGIKLSNERKDQTESHQ